MSKVNSFPLVSIVTINYNQLPCTLDLLRSSENLIFPNVEIIVVDNASVEDPTEEINRLYPHVKVIRSDENLGFSGGNNIGIKAASGEFIFLVNNDTEFTPGLIGGLVDVFHQYPDAGVVSPKFHYYFHPGVIEYAGYQKVHPLTGRNGMVGCREQDTGEHDEFMETNYAHGGGMMVSRAVIEKAGLMPELYFLYYEEFDWCNTIKKAGYKVYYQPKSLIYHKESMSTGKNSALKTYYLTRNRILFMRRNEGMKNNILFLSYFFFLTVPKSTVTYFFTAQWQHLKAFYKAISWNIININPS